MAAFREPNMAERDFQRQEARDREVEQYMHPEAAREYRARMEQERQRQREQAQANAFRPVRYMEGPVRYDQVYFTFGAGGVAGNGGAGAGGAVANAAMFPGGGGAGAVYAQQYEAINAQYIAAGYTARDIHHRGKLREPGKIQRAGYEAHALIKLRDENGLFHCETAPALVLKDGTEYWYWHGLPAQASWIRQPESITLGDIGDLSGSSTDYRRCAIERYTGGLVEPKDDLDGYKRYVRDMAKTYNGHRLDHDERFGTLLQVAHPVDENITIAVVKNRTPEPDGSFTTHYLRVPPEMKTVRAAVAWTFGMEPEVYDPVVET